MVHNPLHRVFLQPGVRIHREKMADAHPTEPQIQRIRLARLAAIQIPHRPILRRKACHSLNPGLCAVGGGIVHRQNADAPAVVLAQQRLNDAGDAFLLVVGAQNDRGILIGFRIFPHPSVQQIGKEHGAHQIAR